MDSMFPGQPDHPTRVIKQGKTHIMYREGIRASHEQFGRERSQLRAVLIIRVCGRWKVSK